MGDIINEDKSFDRLIKNAFENPWEIATLNWDLPVSFHELIDPPPQSLASDTHLYKSLNKEQQRDLRTKETLYHLTNLMYGEYRGITLASQILLTCPEETPKWRVFASSIIEDEAKHYYVLERYLREKACFQQAPHPQLVRILDILEKSSDFRMKLFIAQVVLEWTASSLLASLCSRVQEPLVKNILRRILIDEGRHLAFNNLVFERLPNTPLSSEQQDLLFEGILACICSFIATPVWNEYGFKQIETEQAAVKYLEKIGIMKFYTYTIPRMLAKFNIKADMIVSRLSNNLVNQLVKFQKHYDPQKGGSAYVPFKKSA